MPDQPYTLADLGRLADVTPRTVRYYVAQGLLPSPEAAGPSTRYGDGHLQRLRLIKRLQRDHLPLAEIRGRLERMGDDEVESMLEATTPPPATGPETLAYVQRLMVDSGVQPRVAEARAVYHASEAVYDPSTPDGFPSPPARAVPAPAVLPSAPSLRPLIPDRTTWERHLLTPDVELHVRRPLDRLTNKRLERLIRIARELFDEEP